MPVYFTTIFSIVKKDIPKMGTTLFNYNVKLLPLFIAKHNTQGVFSEIMCVHLGILMLHLRLNIT